MTIPGLTVIETNDWEAWAMWDRVTAPYTEQTNPYQAVKVREMVTPQYKAIQEVVKLMQEGMSLRGACEQAAKKAGIDPEWLWRELTR